MEAEWLLCSHILGVDLPMKDGFIRTLLHRQRPDGSWEVFPGAPGGDINSTVEVYAALTAMGERPDRPELARARAFILANGGLSRIRVFTRYWLALIGVWPWKDTPNLPPEIIRLPLWFPFNIYNFAQWARATMVPLAVLSARRPIFPLPDGNRLDELIPEGRALDAGMVFSRDRPRAAWDSELAADAGPREGDKTLPRMDDPPSRCGRRLGRHSAALDLRPDGAS
jgi:squalene-hopene/tetraprenyl-beta-curcumene cyclase